VLDVHRARRPVDQRREVRDAADRVEIPAALERVAHRDEVERAPGLRQILDRAEQAAVALGVERVVAQQLLDLVDLPVVEEHGTEHGALRVVGVR
jgi:hypothetical protein